MRAGGGGFRHAFQVLEEINFLEVEKTRFGLIRSNFPLEFAETRARSTALNDLPIQLATAASRARFFPRRSPREGRRRDSTDTVDNQSRGIVR